MVIVIRNFIVIPTVIVNPCHYLILALLLLLVHFVIVVFIVKCVLKLSSLLVSVSNK